MRTGRPKTTLTMSNDERAHLLAIALVAGSTDVAGEDRAAARARAQQCRRGRCLQWARGEAPTSIGFFFYPGMTTPILGLAG
jgi:hypothetical protein